MSRANGDTVSGGVSFELFHQVGVGVSTLAPSLELHLTRPRRETAWGLGDE